VGSRTALIPGPVGCPRTHRDCNPQKGTGHSGSGRQLSHHGALLLENALALLLRGSRPSCARMLGTYPTPREKTSENAPAWRENKPPPGGASSIKNNPKRTPADVLDHRKLGYRYDVDHWLAAGDVLNPYDCQFSLDGNYMVLFKLGCLRSIRPRTRRLCFGGRTILRRTPAKAASCKATAIWSSMMIATRKDGGSGPPRSEGYCSSPGWGQDFPKIQVLTTEELPHGAEIKMPPQCGTFKEAQRVPMQEADHLRLDL
jgi:hypothetical protein